MVDEGRDPGRAADMIVGSLLFVGSILYISLWPRNFFIFDEGLFLYEAKRILDGDVIYRDFFEIITPGAFYGMALAFALFGVSIETARMSMACLHAASVLVIYAACRSLGVRRLLAVAAGLGYLVLTYSILPTTSPHRVGTFLMLVLFLVLLRRPWTRSAAHSLVPGLLAGIMLCVQQQKGAVFAAGTALLLAAACLSAESPAARSRTAVRHLTAYAAGFSAVVLPVFVVLLATAGSHALYAALVDFPLGNYREYHEHITWGQNAAGPWGNYFLENDVFRYLITYLPVVGLLPLGQAALALWRRKLGEAVDRPVTMAAFSAMAVLSVFYNPNYIHLAMIAPAFLIVAADLLERLFSLLEHAVWPLRSITAVALLSLCATEVVQLGTNLHMQRTMYPIPHLTSFGTVDFKSNAHVALVDGIRDRLAGSAQRDLFCYAACAGIYLMTDTRNPTRFEVLLPRYSKPEHYAEVLEVLERRQVPYVAYVYAIGVTGKDPVLRYVSEHYHRVPLDPSANPFVFGLFERPEVPG